MLTITCMSLSGGQGKTTSAIFLGKTLAVLGYRVLLVDADPQSSLTFYMGHEVEQNQPTLLEVLKKEVNPEDGIYELEQKNIWLVPSDDALDKVQDFLSSSGMGATIMGKRLQAVSDLFEVCIIDAPPQRSQICLTAVGAADELLIPTEASSKGLNSLMRSLDLIRELQDMDAFSGSILGILPFRDRWLGRTQAKQSQKSIEAMGELAEGITILPSILESEQYKKAIDQGVTLEQLGFPRLQYPFETITEILQAKLSVPKNKFSK